jgi:bifunctional non-homologous end joining protein LigD
MKKLNEYSQKRDLNNTPEPGPSPGARDKSGHLVFVVHKHASSRLHYDLRLELGGVLKSWAIPKGPSLDPTVKRLAMMVEDHPFDYRNFEGVIPKGNYGAGSVIIWDKGLYGHPDAKNKQENERLLADGLKKGVLKFALAGSKLRGGFALIRTKWEKNSWLLLKEKDMYTSTDDIAKKGASVVSGMTVEEMAGRSGDSVPEPAKNKAEKTAEEGAYKNAPLRPMPRRVAPMLSTAVKISFNDPDWIFEVKWDGYRTVAQVSNGHALLYSRNQNSLTNRFSPVAASLEKLGFDAVLDGEVVAIDKTGLPDFQMLQDYKKFPGGRLVYYVFDILYYQGRDLTKLPLIKRKELLQKILPVGGNIRVSDHVWKDGVSFFKAVKKKGLEGIVAKNSKSPYVQGERSPHWLKIKNRVSQDCVITGFTTPRGARGYFGSLVLGVYEKGVLKYAGHSGGGFSRNTLKAMYETLSPLSQKKCPFKTKPPEDMPITWIKPVLVCEVTFTGWTNAGIMRHPVFLRIREDKTAEEAVREIPR